MTKKYYWLKLKRDFFKRHDIQIIESMPNGKDYILFYLKLLCESVDHDGNLRFSEQIPYNEQMLSTITNTNIDIVRSAIKVFTELKMMEVLDDGTYYMNEVNKMLGSETYWAKKKREQRLQNAELPKLDNVQQMSNSSPTCPSKSKRKSKSIELDKDIDINIPESPSEDSTNPPSKPEKEKETKHKYGEYQHVLLTDKQYENLIAEYPNYLELIKFLDEYIEMKGYKAKNHYLAIRKWVVDAVKENDRKHGKGQKHMYPDGFAF